LSLALLPQTLPPVNNLSFQCFYYYHFRAAISDYFVTHNAQLRGEARNDQASALHFNTETNA
ncbi:hypothetical protein, partial [Vibrio parahaemolyticus]|uniref:hypothetical protein n=1 Tax=Vibrio parahaemolyticus TaxID=670 RepID=UPI002AD235CE